MSERNLSMSIDIEQIIATSRRNNSRVGVTGFLMYDGAYFAQVLEGKRSAVTHTYNRIAADLRHYNIHFVSCIDVKERLFPGWHMGLVEGMPVEKREKFLSYFTLERINPENITLERLLYFLQALAAEVRDADYNRIAV
jgi:hypothetical protein